MYFSFMYFLFFYVFLFLYLFIFLFIFYLFFNHFSIYFCIYFFYLFKLKFMVNGHQTFAHYHAYVLDPTEVNVVHQRPDGVLEKTKRFLLL